MNRAVGVIALVVLVVLGVAWAERAAEGRRAVAECDAALARGDLVEGVLAARIALEARCPACAAPEEGFARLERIARDAEARGDDATAFAAWGAVRAGLLATASFGTTSDRRSHAELELARFGHRIDSAAVASGASATPAAAEDRLRTAFAQSDLPSGITFGLVGIGGIAFVIGAIRFALQRGGRPSIDVGLAVAGAAVAATGALLF